MSKSFLQFPDNGLIIVVQSVDIALTNPGMNRKQLNCLIWNEHALTPALYSWPFNETPTVVVL